MFTITFTHAMHAVLLRRYHLGSRCHVKVGDSSNAYGPIDLKTGAEYKCLGFPYQGDNPKLQGKVSHSSDQEVGHFYPEAVIITGRDEKDQTLTHEDLEAIRNAFRNTPAGRIIIPRGYDKGQMTWDNGIKYYPDLAPTWYGIEDDLKKKFPTAELYQPPHCSWIELYFETGKFKDGVFHP